MTKPVSRRHVLSALAAGAGSLASRPSRAAPRDGLPRFAPSADSLVAAYMRRFDTPGLSIALGRGDAPVQTRVYGWADRPRRIAATPDNLWRIASNSKALTSAAVFKLVEAGSFGLDDRVFAPDGLLPAFADLGPRPDWLRAVTVRHLLTHTAGGWSNERDDPMFAMRGLDHAQLIERTLQTHPLEAPPGQRYAYSNFGYCVLGRVIERVGAQPYARFVRERLLAPAGVRDMRIAVRDAAPGEVRYEGHDGGDPYDMPIARMDSHGGWIASPTDVVRWVAGIFSVKDDAGAPPLLGAASLSATTQGSRANPRYGCGWALNPAGNAWHVGSLPGTTCLMVHTAGGLVWAVALNTRSPDAEAIPTLDRMMWQVVADAR